MIDNIKNKIESLHFQECCLKNMSLWNLVISLEASFFNVTFYIQYGGIREITSMPV